MRRLPVRLRDFDYSSSGSYFVTSCVCDRTCAFGAVVNDTVVLSEMGIVARDCLLAIPDRYPSVVLDSFVVMPNHVHAVVVIGDENASARMSLGLIVGTYKAAVSRSLGRRGLWQRGYHDHVVRDEADLQRIREYIEANPIRWALDPENPTRRSLGDIYVAPTHLCT